MIWAQKKGPMANQVLYETYIPYSVVQTAIWKVNHDNKLNLTCVAPVV